MSTSRTIRFICHVPAADATAVAGAANHKRACFPGSERQVSHQQGVVKYRMTGTGEYVVPYSYQAKHDRSNTTRYPPKAQAKSQAWLELFRSPAITHGLLMGHFRLEPPADLAPHSYPASAFPLIVRAPFDPCGNVLLPTSTTAGFCRNLKYDGLGISSLHTSAS